MEVSLALRLSLTPPIDHLSYLLVVLLDVVQVVLVILDVVQQTAAAQELHLSGQGLQLTPELPVLLLQLSHGSSQRAAEVGRVLQTPLHAQLKSTDVHVDLPDGVPKGVLVPR